jgi:hypothetical protein
MRNFETVWRSRSVAGCVFAGLLLLSLVGCSESQKSTEMLFVQTAHRVTFVDNTMTLHDVSPTTLFFSDRPERVTGHQGTKIFVDNWGKGHNSFAEDPPNAALVILGDDDVEVAEVVVELKAPKYDDNKLSYVVTVLEGEMPSSGQVSALFIDAVIITDPYYGYHDTVVVAPSLYGPLSYRGQSRRVARRTARRVSRRR